MNIRVETLDAMKSAFIDVDLPNFRDHLVEVSSDGVFVNFCKKGRVQRLKSDVVPWLISI